jgi:hypothetical protein
MFTFTKDELEDKLSVVMKMTVEFLYDQKVISKEDYEEFHINYAIILKKPNFFSKIWNFLTKEENLNFIIVRQCSLPDPPDDDNGGDDPVNEPSPLNEIKKPEGAKS